MSAVLGAAEPQIAGLGAEPADQSTIVVTGKKNTENDIRDFVRGLTPARSQGQISRFEQSICPVAIGLPGRQAGAVAGRMRLVAEAVGIRVGRIDCIPNVVVVITSNKRAFLQELQRSRPEYFGQMPRRRVRQLAQETEPAAAWQLAGPPVSARGVEIQADPNLGVHVNRTAEPASRISAAARPQFEAAVVVVERAALDGLTTTQLADYAAMRAFAATVPTRLASPNTPTILRVLEAPMGSEVPTTMTHWDLGFLRGLYTSPQNLSAAQQRSAIQKSVEQELER